VAAAIVADFKCNAPNSKPKTPLTNGEILARILGQDRTLDEVIAAFSGRHPTIPAYTWYL
jgi:hypothetical protein